MESNIFNTLLYGGFLLIISGVILFIVSIIKLREIEREEFRQDQLHKAFMKARKNINGLSKKYKWTKK